MTRPTTWDTRGRFGNAPSKYPAIGTADSWEPVGTMVMTLAPSWSGAEWHVTESNGVGECRKRVGVRVRVWSRPLLGSRPRLPAVAAPGCLNQAPPSMSVRILFAAAFSSFAGAIG